MSKGLCLCDHSAGGSRLPRDERPHGEAHMAWGGTVALRPTASEKLKPAKNHTVNLEVTLPSQLNLEMITAPADTVDAAL